MFGYFSFSAFRIGRIASNSLSLASGPGTTVNIAAGQPGTYTVTAVTNFTATNPNDSPPTITTVASVTLAPPNGVTKGGSLIGVPIAYPGSMMAVDAITAGGYPVGPNTGGLAQESINGGVWYPTNGSSSSFQRVGGAIQDQIGVVGDPALPQLTQQIWNNAPVSTTTPVLGLSWSQNLRLSWYMTGVLTSPTGQVLGSGNYNVFNDLGTLDWAMYKVSTTQFEVQ